MGCYYPQRKETKNGTLIKDRDEDDEDEKKSHLIQESFRGEGAA